MPTLQHDEATQDMFTALADPTRRGILELLATRGRMSATDIYGRFSMSHPAVSQHLRVLRKAEMVRLEKDAQRHIYSLNRDGIRRLEDWVSRTTELWDERFEMLDTVLEAEKRKITRKGR
ncbi:MAG TPA: metalloregulator ArsR/SmtB family transcription factor [Candidatus Dormibacteraeota bacterium]|jgi:DNA-binding transcriptional ArsR family regulator|nr:metalloregulator ArsR/SmtB family transcription factor [Candidatus Dormibacteraeota bacterium]